MKIFLLALVLIVMVFLAQTFLKEQDVEQPSSEDVEETVGEDDLRNM